jgi:hypothetical protein
MQILPEMKGVADYYLRAFGIKADCNNKSLIKRRILEFIFRRGETTNKEMYYHFQDLEYKLLVHYLLDLHQMNLLDFAQVDEPTFYNGQNVYQFRLKFQAAMDMARSIKQ